MHKLRSRPDWTLGIFLASLLIAMSCQAQSSPAAAVSLNPQPLPPRTVAVDQAASTQERAAIIIVSGKPAKDATRKARKWKPVPAPGTATVPAKVTPPSP